MHTLTSIALASIVILSQGCPPSATESTTPTIQCPAGQHALSTSCAWDAVTITIGPDVQTFTTTPLGGGPPHVNALTGCYVFSPNPQSVHRNQVVNWANNTSVSVTVYQFDTGTPLTTVAPGQTSGGVFWSTAGTVQVRVGSCNSGDATPGQIVITVS